MSNTPAYAVSLDAIGLYVERAGGIDLGISELAEGFLVAFVDADGQHVGTLDEDDMLYWQAEADQQKGRGLFRKRDEVSAQRQRLRAVGRYLDKRQGSAILLQERADGYAIAYTGLLDVPADAIDLVRLSETLDDEQLRTL